MTRICFVSYEIHPATAGGCGVLLYNAARALLSQGHEVIFVLDLSATAFHRFQNQDRLRLPNPDHCQAYLVEELCAALPQHREDFGSDALWRAYRLDFACRQVAERERPDLIEFFDYYGVGHYALSAKLAGLAYNRIHLAVRLHNSIEILGVNEAAECLSFWHYAIHALEHSSLRLAETVLYPSRAYLEETYLPYYEPWFGGLAWSKPPLIDHPKRETVRPKADIALFYGRLFAWKGMDRFVDAAMTYLVEPANPPLRFYLVGYDSMLSPLPGLPSCRDYLLRKIPSTYREYFTFTGPLSWAQLEQILPAVQFAVIPSYCESFCYAAHELYAAGVPLIVSDIPAFRDYFKEGKNALVFDGSVSDLARQMARLSRETELRQRLSCPYSLADAPLGDFYTRQERVSWMNLESQSQGLSLLVVVLAEAAMEADIQRTMEALRQVGVERVVLLRPATEEEANGTPVWILGGLYTMQDSQGSVLSPTTVRTAETLLILRAGDQPHTDFIQRGLKVLARQPQIAFVGCWKRICDNENERLQTFPLDAMLELVPFEGLSPFSRCLMRTPPERLLLDLFDPRSGRWGELAYLWTLEDDDHNGLLIPEALLEQLAEPLQPIPSQVLSYLILRDRSSRRKARLSRYLLVMSYTLRNAATGEQMHQHIHALEQELREAQASLGWKLTVSSRSFRKRVAARLGQDPIIGQRVVDGLFCLRQWLLGRVH